MLKIEKMLETICELMIPEENMSQLPMQQTKNPTPHEIVNIIKSMDNSLSYKQSIAVMNEQGYNRKRRIIIEKN